MKTIFELTTVMLLYAAACPAGVLYQTAPQPASYVFNGNYGDSEINNWQWLATEFILTQQSNVTSVGGEFNRNGAQPAFAAIIAGPLPHQPFDWFVANIESIALAHVLLTAPGHVGSGGDVDVPLSVNLLPGTYELIFGTLAFGATGTLQLNNCCSSDPGKEMAIKAYQPYPLAWTTQGIGNPNSAANGYLFVKGDPAGSPEPSSFLLIVSALIVARVIRKRCMASGLTSKR